MGDSIDDFLDFGDDNFADEYANLNRCEGSPSSEDVEINPLENSISALSGTSQHEVDLEMSDFALGASLGASWTGVNDSFSQMRVKTEPQEKENKTFEEPVTTIPGSWPTARPALKSTALKNQVPALQNPQLLQPTSFTMSQIAPPSLPQERSSSTAGSSLCSESIKEEEEEANCHVSDLTERAHKRRASETTTRMPMPAKASHKRTTSNASSTPFLDQDAISALPVGIELDESGDPIVAKRQDRLMRNRAAALASRERKREHVMRLETSVVDLENEKTDLQKQVYKMHDEILRLRKILAEQRIEDKQGGNFVVDTPQTKSVAKAPTPQPEQATSSMPKPDVASIARTKAAPTGFSPRGALKKSEIIANQIRAEEHLRNVTMRQAGIRPLEPAPTTTTTTTTTATTPKAEPMDTSADGSEKCADETPKVLPVTIEKHAKSSSSGGSVVFMILIFGIALFANTTPAGNLNLTGFSRDPGSSGLLLQLPQNFGEVCPETVISQLRGQGFMLSEEIEDLEIRNLLTADHRAGSVSPTTSTTVSEGDLANWVTTHDGGDLAYEVGNTFTIAAPAQSSTPASTAKEPAASAIAATTLPEKLTVRREASSSSSSSSSADNKARQWRILECEIKRVQELDDVATRRD